jgi:8-oxo-dGTP pyrophosphatase MutT (NUDIX family)
MIKPWKVLSSEILLCDKWIRIRADQCQKADGVVIEPYYVNEQPEWVCVLPLTNDGKVILTTEYRHGAGSVVTGLPGGVVEDCDSEPMVAAKRELTEETGYTSDNLVSLGALYANWANQSNRIHYFLAKDVVKVGYQELDSTEEIEVTAEPIERLAEGGFLKQSFHVACLHLAQQHLRKELGLRQKEMRLRTTTDLRTRNR